MIVENELTQGVNAIEHIGNGRVVVGTSTGKISLWQYSRPQTFKHVRTFASIEETVRFLLPYSENKFISISGPTDVKVWSLDSGSYRQLKSYARVCEITSAAVLPNNLLVVGGYDSQAWMCFDVYELASGRQIHWRQNFIHRPRSILLATTVQGFLVTAGECHYDARVWKIDRSECKIIGEGVIGRIYSLAALLSGEVVTGTYHSMDFYRISVDEGKVKFWKSIKVGNVVDHIWPVGGYKLVTFDRSRSHSGVIKLWDYMKEDYQELCYGLGMEYCTLLERESTLLSRSENRNGIRITELAAGVFHFPKQLAEMRKNARLLFQARENGTGFFAKLPDEILLRIAILTCDHIDCGRDVIRRIAENHFSRPALADNASGEC